MRCGLGRAQPPMGLPSSCELDLDVEGSSSLQPPVPTRAQCRVPEWGWQCQSQQQGPEGKRAGLICDCFPGGSLRPGLAGNSHPGRYWTFPDTFWAPGPWHPGGRCWEEGPAPAPTGPALSPLLPLVTALFLWAAQPGAPFPPCTLATQLA